MQSRTWLNWAAIGTWLVVCLPTLYRIATGRVVGASAVVFAAAFLVFGLMLTIVRGEERLHARFRPASVGPPARRCVPALALETICGLVMMYISRDGTPGATL